MQTALARWAVLLIMMIAGLCARAEDPLLGMAVEVDIPPQQLATALIALSRQAGIQLQMPSEIVAGLRTGGARGAMTLSAAFEKLLDGTPLTFHSAGTRTIGIQHRHDRDLRDNVRQGDQP